MAKKSELMVAAHERPEDNNWELPENEKCAESEESGVRSKEQDLKAELALYVPEELRGVMEPDGDYNIAKEIVRAWQSVVPEIRDGNPVWIMTIKPDQIIFIFQDGRKVRVPHGTV